MLALVLVFLSFSSSSLWAAPASEGGRTWIKPIPQQPTVTTPTGPIIQAPVDQDDQDQDTTTVDDSAPAPVYPDDSAESSYTAPVHYEPAHYSINDLASSIHSLGPDPFDPNHHTMSEIGGL